MKLDETGPIARYRIDTDVDWVGVGGTKGDLHEVKPLHTCGFDLLPVELFVLAVEAYCHVETVGEARIGGGPLVHRNLRKM